MNNISNGGVALQLADAKLNGSDDANQLALFNAGGSIVAGDLLSISGQTAASEIAPEIMTLIMNEADTYQDMDGQGKHEMVEFYSAVVQDGAHEILNNPAAESVAIVLASEAQSTVEDFNDYISTDVDGEIDGGEKSADDALALFGAKPSAKPFVGSAVNNQTPVNLGDANDSSSAEDFNNLVSGYKKFFPGFDWNFLNSCDPVFRVGFAMLMLMNGPYSDIFDDLSHRIAINGLYASELENAKNKITPVSEFFVNNADAIGSGIDTFAAFYYYMWQNHPDQCDQSQPPTASPLEQKFAAAMKGNFFDDMYQQLQQYNQSNPNNQITANMLASGDTAIYNEATNVGQVPQQAFMHFYVAKTNQVAAAITKDPAGALFTSAWTTADSDNSFFQSNNAGGFKFMFTLNNVEAGIGGSSGVAASDGILQRCSKLSQVALTSQNTTQQTVDYYNQVWANSTTAISSSVIPGGNFSWIGSQ